MLNVDLTGAASPYGKAIPVAIAEFLGGVADDNYSGRFALNGKPAVLIRAPYRSEAVAVPGYLLKRVKLIYIAWEVGPHLYNKIAHSKLARLAKSLTRDVPAIVVTIEFVEKEGRFVRNVMPEFCATKKSLKRWNCEASDDITLQYARNDKRSR